MSNTPPAANPPRRLLVRGVNWLGDAVLSTPALLRLRERFPAARISVLAPAKLADLWRHHPAVDAVMTFQPDDTLLRTARRLRRETFEVALAFPNSIRSALELWLARIPERYGTALGARRFLLTHPIPPRPAHGGMRKRTPAEIRRLLAAGPGATAVPEGAALAGAHHVHQYLHLVAALGVDPQPVAPRLEVTPEEVAAALGRLGLDSGGSAAIPLLGLNPGAEYGPAKRWPASRFVAAAVAVQQRERCRWLVLGGAADRDLAEQVTAGIRASAGGNAVALAGRTSLRELMAVVRACRVLLTNDTGPMHVAAALGTPVVALFGSTSPELTGPSVPGVVSRSCSMVLREPVPCAPCFLRQCPVDLDCLMRLSPETVAEAVLVACHGNGSR